MNHRHLLPDEIDLLVDGEVGFGVAPLKAHVKECAHCRALLDEARELCEAIEQLPHHAPSPLFAERVMSRVQVFVPWHVAALDTVRRWAPQSRPARVLVGATAGSVALALSVVSIWIATRLDVLIFGSSAVLEQARAAALGAVGSLLVDLFGRAVIDGVSAAGGVGITVAILSLLGATAATTAALRALAGVASRRRS